MQEEQKNKQSIAWALAIIFGIATAMFGYLYTTQKSKLSDQEAMVLTTARELSVTKTKLDSISVALDAKIAEVEKLGGDITELTKVKTQLEADKLAFSRTRKNESGKYLAKIKEYEKFLTEKDELIAQLRTENQYLIASNDSLNTHVGSLNTERERLVRRESELGDSVKTFTVVNKELSDKVSRGAALKAQNVKVLTVTTKGKVKDKSQYKSSRVDKIQIQFNLAENPITEQEPKDIYLRVMDPDGAVVSNDATGSGEFEINGTPVKFTTRETVGYQNNNQKVEILYDYTGKFRAGKYAVELYSEGHKIGTGGFSIK